MSSTQVEDLPQQVEGDLVETTWPRLQELLEKHPEARGEKPGRARTLALFGVLCRLCWPQFVAAGICRLFYIVTGYAQPLGLYIILRRFGTDFTMMLTAFPGRTQRQLKNKFKRENRTQSALVSLALDASIAVDVKAPMVIEAAPVEKPSSRQITYGPDAGVFLFDPALDAEKDLKPV